MAQRSQSELVWQGMSAGDLAQGSLVAVILTSDPCFTRSSGILVVRCRTYLLCNYNYI